jgi:hypothetical protein
MHAFLFDGHVSGDATGSKSGATPGNPIDVNAVEDRHQWAPLERSQHQRALRRAVTLLVASVILK